MHHREKHLTTNTAVLAKRVLTNCEVFERGLPEKPFNISELNILPDESLYFLFPSEDAITLDSDFVKNHVGLKIHLIVPDGSWRQAKKFHRREKSFSNITCVKLPDGFLSQYKLRKEPRADGLCTYEAIASALLILENSELLYDKLMETFNLMVSRFIKSRYHFHE
jgi:DTW domain-containing protein YfiP